MLRDFLQRKLFPAEPFHQDAFHEAIRARLPRCGKVLDLGCGDHAALKPYRTAEREVWGTDFHRHPRLAEPEWFRLLGPNGAIPFPDNTFDLIASDWVIEHVALPRVFLSEVKRVLKPGGRYVAHSISGAHYLTWVRRLFDLAPHELVQEVIYRLYRREHHDTFPTHYRLNTVGQIEAGARAAGLEIEALEFFATQHYFHFSSVLETLAIVADRFLECFGTGLGRIYFVLVLRKSA
ncbi:MAG: methyltransferase domain-containing protein [Gemmataceae bacterium]